MAIDAALPVALTRRDYLPIALAEQSGWCLTYLALIPLTFYVAALYLARRRISRALPPVSPGPAP